MFCKEGESQGDWVQLHNSPLGGTPAIGRLSFLLIFSDRECGVSQWKVSERNYYWMWASIRWFGEYIRRKGLFCMALAENGDNSVMGYWRNLICKEEKLAQR